MDALRASHLALVQEEGHKVPYWPAAIIIYNSAILIIDREKWIYQKQEVIVDIYV